MKSNLKPSIQMAPISSILVHPCLITSNTIILQYWKLVISCPWEGWLRLILRAKISELPASNNYWSHAWHGWRLHVNKSNELLFVLFLSTFTYYLFSCVWEVWGCREIETERTREPWVRISAFIRIPLFLFGWGNVVFLRGTSIPIEPHDSLVSVLCRSVTPIPDRLLVTQK